MERPLRGACPAGAPAVGQKTACRPSQPPTFSNARYIRKLYLGYPIVQTLSELYWSHYIELLKIEEKL